MYKVIVRFADMQDKNHIYEIGDVFPRDGKTVTDKRIAELASDANKVGKPVIEEVELASVEEVPEITEEIIEDVPDEVVEEKPKASKKADK